MRRFAGVEGGGTTWVCAISEGSPTNIVERAEFPTTTPAETLAAVAAWLAEHRFDALGIATFGPVDLDPASLTYGSITATPKPGWRDTPVVAALCKEIRVPFAFDTDVNAPALAEHRAAAAEGLNSTAYVTIGTGVGLGLVVNGHPVHGLLHPEGGHISVPRRAGDSYAGYNSMLKCDGWYEVEAMCGSGALAARAGLASAKELGGLPDDHEVWDLCAHYLAAMCANLVLTASPERIVLSGGVMQRRSLFPRIRAKTVAMLNGYIPAVDAAMIDGYIVPSRWGNDAGIVGALTLAVDALERSAPAPKPARPSRFAALLLTVFAAGCVAGFAVRRA
ncbi:hypothetical protein M885DRAFT_532431 [Pelagophyceae sp. CCMP2097]|nr:hypothetical protein M885DRAFT_532431 [Pelagophyceae sp. CCMP2097]|mmetsp:Transcript_23626/g.79745  ORF Transcript_23626/g.79745 Transcript_23626/m.79745 type:complete len:335 (-) Transcript_23626:56-1060(-)